MFHVSQLKKCLRVPEEQIPLEELTVKEDLTYEESGKDFGDDRKGYKEPRYKDV